MKEIAAGSTVTTQATCCAGISQHGYTRTAANEIDQLFPLVHNPMLVMYVFPHISKDLPVPGYSTAFRMYRQDHFALPEEQ